MKNRAWLQVDGRCLRPCGDLTFDTVTTVLADGQQWLEKEAPVRCYISLQQVNYCNSAAMALLLAWLRTARKAGKELTIEHVPDTLAALIRLSKLEKELGINSEG